MSLLVRAFPLKKPVKDFEAFVAELHGTRKNDVAAFYESHGIAHESLHLQETDHGPWVIVVTLLRNVQEAAPRYAAATDEFSTWFKSQVLTLSGIDPTTTPLGPPTKEVYRWSGNTELSHTLLR